MNNHKEQLIEKFQKIKALGFVSSHRKNNTGIGKTFEDYIGVVENNADEPDLLGYEFKSHREESSSYTTLFTKSPSFPKGANKYLRDIYGQPYDGKPELKRIHTSMFATKGNTYAGKYSFRLINYHEDSTIRIGVFDLKSGALLDSSVGYNYKDIERVIERKLKNLFYVSAERKYEEDTELFAFTKAKIYTNPTLERFLKMLDDGLIMYDIRIGSYSSGKSIGKPHDHGSGFRILEANLRLLYAEEETVE